MPRRTLGILLLLASTVAHASDARRLIEADPSGSTSRLRRVVLDSDSRLVLGGGTPRTVVDEREVALPEAGPVRFPIELPPALASAAAVQIDAQVAVEQPAVPATGRTTTRRFAGRTTIWRPGDADPVVEVDIPPPDRRQPAYLSVSAREIGPERSVHRLGPLEIPADPSRLDFAFGVEPAGWGETSPAVVFSVVAQSADGRVRPLWSRTIDPSADERDRRWHDASVSLAPVAGETVELSFRALPTPSGDLGTLGVFANPTIRTMRATKSKRRNLIVISADTLRARSLGTYGYARPTSPTMDRRLAGEGARVRDVIAPMPFTPASHMTMLTGLAPCDHGVFGIFDALPPDRITLAERLRAAGYATAAFTEDAFLVAGGGFDRGFDVYVENRGGEYIAAGFADQTFEGALRWLDRDPGEPFFLFVHTYQVHFPYTPPRGFEEVLPATDDDGELARERDLYDREIRHLDEILGTFLDGLERLDLADDTVVVLTSDHGEGFGEHAKAVRHDWYLYDEVLRVPLLVRSPGQIPAGTEADIQVGLIDLTPTVLDLLDLEVPDGLSGRSFAGVLRGDGSEAMFEDRTVLSRSKPLGLDSAGRPQSRKHSVRTKDAKYIRSGKQHEEFFDLRTDPEEQVNLARARPDDVARLRTVLDEHLAACERRRGGRDRAETPVARAPDWLRDASLDMRKRLEQTREKLRSLGYVE